MTQTTYTSSRILQPTRLRFVILTLVISLLLNFLPTRSWPFTLDWVMLLLCFWAIREPDWVKMGTAFLLGLAMDVADTSLMGQHALAYIPVVFVANRLTRRILWFKVPMQALHVLPLILGGYAIQWLIVFLTSDAIPKPEALIGPLLITLLWIPLTFLLLLPQFRKSEDDNDQHPI